MHDQRIGQWTVPQPAIYEVRAIGVKLSARQNRRRWRLGAVNPSGFRPVTPDRAAIYAKHRFVEADEGDLGCPVQSPPKNFPFRARPKSVAYPSPSRLSEGRFAIVMDVRRDAVDAEGASDESA